MAINKHKCSDRKAIVHKSSFQMSSSMMSEITTYIRVFDTEKLFQAAWQEIINSASVPQTDSFKTTIQKDLIVFEQTHPSYHRDSNEAITINYFS